MALAGDSTNYYDNNQTGPKYYTTLRFQTYERPKPFANTNFTDVAKFILPLPQTINDNVVADWSGQNLDVIGNLINDGVEGAAMGGAYKNVGNAINSLGTTVAKSMGNAITKKMGSTLGDVLAGAADTLLPPEQIQNAVEASMGAVSNPNPTLMFKGPTLRQFNFRWIFYPKSQEEVNNIHKMTNLIKRYMLPETIMQRQSSLLKYPKMCMINFYPWDDNGSKPAENPSYAQYGWSDQSIIKIKRCGVTACNVNYSPGTTPSFFADSGSGVKNMPTIIEMNITLHEMEYMVADDWGDTTNEGFTNFIARGAAQLANTGTLGAVGFATNLFADLTAKQ